MPKKPSSASALDQRGRNVAALRIELVRHRQNFPHGEIARGRLDELLLLGQPATHRAAKSRPPDRMPEPCASPFVSCGAGRRAHVMLKWAIIFLIISVVAGALGFTGLSATAARISKILFAIFFVLFLLVVGMAILAGEFLLTR